MQFFFIGNIIYLNFIFIFILLHWIDTTSKLILVVLILSYSSIEIIFEDLFEGEY